MRVLETERYRLVPLTAADSIRMYVPFCDPALYFFVPSDPPATLGALTDRFAKLERRLSSDGAEQWLNWVIERQGPHSPSTAGGGSTPKGGVGKDDGRWPQPLGLIEATIMPDGHALIGYYTFREFWNQGVASACIPVVLAHLQSDYGVRLFRAEADSRNFASVRVLEKCGFHIAETVPQADFFKGHRSDEHRMVKLAG
jgi:[ribosomal protein S5]-alanine N-acetyltransferase